MFAFNKSLQKWAGQMADNKENPMFGFIDIESVELQLHGAVKCKTILGTGGRYRNHRK